MAQYFGYMIVPDVLHMICTQLCPGQLSICVGDCSAVRIIVKKNWIAPFYVIINIIITTTTTTTTATAAATAAAAAAATAAADATTATTTTITDIISIIIQFIVTIVMIIITIIAIITSGSISRSMFCITCCSRRYKGAVHSGAKTWNYGRFCRGLLGNKQANHLSSGEFLSYASFFFLFSFFQPI